MVQLPAYQIPENAMLNFQPINSALDSYQQGQRVAGISTAQANAANAMARGDYTTAAAEAARSGDLGAAVTLRRQPLELQALQDAQRQRERQELGAQAQGVLSIADPAQRQAAASRLFSSDPRWTAAISAHGLDPSNHDAILNQVVSEALGPQPTQLHQVGADQNGQPVYAWVNAGTRSATPLGNVGGVVTNQAQTGLTGQAYLDTLDPARQTLLKQIYEGRVAPPSAAHLRPGSPSMILLNQMSQAYPGFDATNWGARYRTATQFSAGGPVGQQIESVNKVLNHLSDFYDSIDALGNYDRMSVLNPARNAVRGQTDPAFIEARSRFEANRQTAITELAKALRGTGAMNEHEVRQWEEQANSNSSPTALRTMTQTAIKLIMGRLEPAANNYNTTMGTTRTPETFLSPQAQEHIAKITGVVRDNRAAVGPDNRGPAAGTEGAPVLVDNMEQALRMTPGTWVRRASDGRKFQVPNPQQIPQP